jgi:hypothetical protein
MATAQETLGTLRSPLLDRFVAAIRAALARTEPPQRISFSDDAWNAWHEHGTV